MTHRNVHRLVAMAGLSATSLYAAQPANQSSVLSDAYYNTAMGPLALSSDVTPGQTCVPYAFSHKNFFMSGCANTAVGIAALRANSTGFNNTADGAGALYKNTVGSDNTAVGSLAMFNADTGDVNAAFGTGALFANTGTANSALGAYALFNNTLGAFNTSVGHDSMYYNVSGKRNTAVGQFALGFNTSGSTNTGIGNNSLSYNLTGSNNTALGSGSLIASSTGIGNTAVGALSGGVLATGSYNTYIGYDVTAGNKAESYVTRIGVFTTDPNVSGAPTVFISGIGNTVIPGGTPVVINQTTGQLGYAGSSERYKTDITPLASSTDKLSQLRAVSFHIKTDPNGAIQYGLIAEEVDKVYPELVIRDAEGRIQGVRYDELAPLLLNEVQKEHSTVATLVAQHEADAAKIASLEQKVAAVDDLKQQLSAVIQELTARDKLVALH